MSMPSADVVVGWKAGKPSVPKGKKARDAFFKDAYDKAFKAGEAAAAACVPRPMHVVQRANPFDDNSPIVKDWGVYDDGVCGFAWVNIRPGNSAFGNWLKKNGKARKAYGGGLQVWIGGYGQSMERKEAHAFAMAASLRESLPEVSIYADSRMD